MPDQPPANDIPVADAGVKSALRVFEVLELFRAEQRPLRLKEVVARLGHPASSMTGLLKTMLAAGYLEHDQATRAYFPTVRLAHLVGWVPGAAFEGGPVAQALRNLSRATGELIVLGTVDDVVVEYVEALRASHGMQLWTPPGTRIPLINLGLGWLFLAHGAAGDAAQIHRRTLELGLVPPAEFPIGQLEGRIAGARGRRWLFTNARAYPAGHHPGHPGGGMLWGLVPTPPRHRPLGIGIGGPADRIEANLAAYSAAMERELDGLAVAAREVV